MEDEKNRIQLVIAKNELYLLESQVQSSEELTGKVRAAVGKAKLLLAQKFEQFAGLCRKNLVCFQIMKLDVTFFVSFF